MAQGHLDEVVAAEAAELVGVAIKRERTFNTFRQYTEEFICVEDAGGVLTAGEHASEPGDGAGDRPDLEQAGMGKGTPNASGVALNDVQRHDGVPGHEAAMVADQDGAAFTGEVIETRGFNAPVVFGKEVEEMAAGMDEGEVGRAHLQGLKPPI